MNRAPYLSTLAEAKMVASGHAHRGTPVALCSGCFDVMHAGHLSVFDRANLLGEVFVGVNTDESIRQLKGPKRPINPLRQRADLLASLRQVSFVFPIEDTTVTSAIMAVSPSYWLKGGDYTLETLNQDEVRAARQVKAEIILVPVVSGISTTSILARL